MLKLWIESLAEEFRPHAPTHSRQSWKDCVVSLMGWTTSSLSFEADKPFKTMTNILLQFCPRKKRQRNEIGTRVQEYEIVLPPL